MNGMTHPLQQFIPQQMIGQVPQQPMITGIPQFMNPVQKMSFIMQAMQNPAQFVRQHLSGIPEQAFQDPTGNMVLQYMQQNMGVSQQDIVNAQNQFQQMQNRY